MAVLLWQWGISTMRSWPSLILVSAARTDTTFCCRLALSSRSWAFLVGLFFYELLVLCGTGFHQTTFQTSHLYFNWNGTIRTPAVLK